MFLSELNFLEVPKSMIFNYESDDSLIKMIFSGFKSLFKENDLLLRMIPMDYFLFMAIMHGG